MICHRLRLNKVNRKQQSAVECSVHSSVKPHSYLDKALVHKGTDKSGPSWEQGIVQKFKG